MSGREWKPGDVALVGGEVCMYLGRGRGWEHGRPDRFPYHEDRYDARPLVVINPEDREQIERFREIASRWPDQVPYSDMRKPGDMDHTDAMQAALREFADPKPPKPEEPTGLGAVVRDDQDRLFVREFDGWWRTYEPGARNWAAVDAIEVLSPGYEQGSDEPLADWEIDLLRGQS